MPTVHINAKWPGVIIHKRKPGYALQSINVSRVVTHKTREPKHWNMPLSALMLEEKCSGISDNVRISKVWRIE